MDRRHFLFLLSAGLGGTGLGLSGGCGQSVHSVHIPGVALPSLEEEPDKGKITLSGDGTLLRYRFKKGEELRWNVQQTLKMKNIIGGMEENIETSSRSVKIWKTLDVDTQGTATFEYRVEDVDMHQAQTGHDDAVYNSRRDRIIPPAFVNLEGKIGIPLAHIRIDTQGQTTKKPLREYEGRVSENRIVIPLPNEAISSGSSWSEPKLSELPQPDRTVKKFKTPQDFSLEKLHSGLATIKFAAFSFTPLTAMEETQLFEHFASGTMELDLEAGHFIRQEATIDKMVVGVQGASDSIRYLSRLTECCCGRRACEICMRNS
jgi:hypothetical protein